MTRDRLLPILAVAGLIAPLPLQADAPPEPASIMPMRKTCSFNGQFCESFSRTTNRTTIQSAKANPKFKPWSFPGRLSTGIIANHGNAVAIIPASANLLPIGTSPETIILTFYTPGKGPSILRLRHVVAKPANLPPTASHVQWASSYGFEADGLFTLNTAEGQKFRIDPRTGNAMNRRYF